MCVFVYGLINKETFRSKNSERPREQSHGVQKPTDRLINRSGKVKMRGKNERPSKVRENRGESGSDFARDDACSFSFHRTPAGHRVESSESCRDSNYKEK